MSNNNHPNTGSLNQEPLVVGHMLNNQQYRIESVLDRGGSAIVYLAFDTRLNHEVAIKEYMPQGIAKRVGKADVKYQDPQDQREFDNKLTAFRYESKHLVQYNHPAIVRVYNAFDENNTAYFVMDFCSGSSLKTHLALINKMSEPTVKDLIERLIPAVKHLHQKELIHSDIKPSNIGLNEHGHPVLLDFGAARKISEVNDTLTVSFTSGYACPEQYNGKTLKPMFDIYSLAATAYECLTGIKPPPAFSNDTYEPLSAILPTTSFTISIDKALSLNPDNRPKTLDDWLKSWGPVGNDDVTKVKRVRPKSEDDYAPPKTFPKSSKNSSLQEPSGEPSQPAESTNGDPNQPTPPANKIT